MEDLVKHLKKETRSLQRVADNPDRSPKTREAFNAQYQVYEEVLRELKAGTDPQEIIALLNMERAALSTVINPTYTQIGRRQAAYSLIEELLRTVR